MNKYEETFNSWNKVAWVYQQKFMDFPLYNESYDVFCSSITANNPTILEVWCGPGNITRYLLDKRPDFDIEWTDIAPAMITLAQQNNPEAKFEVMDARAIDSLEASYNAIMCWFCIPYFSPDDCEKFIHNCRNLLKGKWVLYISFVDGEPERSWFRTGSTWDRMYFYYHTTQRIQSLLVNNSFEIKNIINLPYPQKDWSTETHTIIIATRLD